MSPFYKRNLEILKKKHPRIAEKVAKVSLSDKIQVFESRSGKLTFKITANGKKISFHSAYDPIKQSKKIIADARSSGILRDTSNVAIMGLGFGYIASELISQKNDRDFIIIIEDNLEVFKHYISNFDINDILSNKNVFLFLDEPVTEIFRFLQQFSFSIVSNDIDFLKLQPAYELNSGFYLKAERSVLETRNWARINIATQVNKIDNFSDNIVANFPTRSKSPGINMLENVFKDVPGIIVATGPSLRKNINLLRLAKNKAVIIALDSSLKILMEEGIIPDLVFSVDFTENTISDYDGIDSLDKTFIVVDNEVCPKVVQKYPERIFFIDLPDKPLCEWFSKITEDKGKIEKGLSVSHTAFLSAIYMGIDPIILIGQDLSYPEGETHARGTSLGFPIKKTSLSDDKKYRVENIFGFPVPTDRSMLVFLHHYRDLINKNPLKKVIDATEGGAKIEDTKIMTLKNALLTYCKDEIDFYNIINKKYDSGRKNITFDMSSLGSIIHQNSVRLKMLSSRSKDHLNFLNKLEEYFKNNDFINLKKGLNKLNNKLSFLTNEFKEELIFLRDNITEAIVFLTSKTDPEISKDNKKNIQEQMVRKKKFFEILISASDKMQTRLETLGSKIIKE
ncbi:MAG: motility associated factor glycosyltransferase family protein [Candidatus Aureabacteria bacterium]|nr:motility associated factor glycosyltransferase family protein [Candidatus Auribacterota bacterium]